MYNHFGGVQDKFFFFSTSVVVSFLTETLEAEIEVLLDLDLTEDLLELFGIPAEASLLFVAWDSVSPCSERDTTFKTNAEGYDYSRLLILTMKIPLGKC